MNDLENSDIEKATTNSASGLVREKSKKKYELFNGLVTVRGKSVENIIHRKVLFAYWIIY